MVQLLSIVNDTIPSYPEDIDTGSYRQYKLLKHFKQKEIDVYQFMRMTIIPFRLKSCALNRNLKMNRYGFQGQGIQDL